jgi:hypothetical protein
LKLRKVVAIAVWFRPISGPLRCPSGARLVIQRKKKERRREKEKKRLNVNSGLCCEGLGCFLEQLSTLVNCLVEL